MLPKFTPPARISVSFNCNRAHEHRPIRTSKGISTPPANDDIPTKQRLDAEERGGRVVAISYLAETLQAILDRSSGILHFVGFWFSLPYSYMLGGS